MYAEDWRSSTVILFSKVNYTFFGRFYPIHIFFGSNNQYCSRGRNRYTSLNRNICRVCVSVAVLSDTSVRSPGNLSMIITWKNSSWVKISPYNNKNWSQNHWPPADPARQDPRAAGCVGVSGHCHASSHGDGAAQDLRGAQLGTQRCHGIRQARCTHTARRQPANQPHRARVSRTSGTAKLSFFQIKLIVFSDTLIL